MMVFIPRKKKAFGRLFLFVTALDKQVIARPNLRVDENCWHDLPVFNEATLLQPMPLCETMVFDHLHGLYESEKYAFLWPTRDDFEEILERVIHLELPEILWREIAWLHRFGYYYHHALAVFAMIARFGLDSGMSYSKLEMALKSALLMDIGISRLPNSILFSSQIYSEEERLLMDQHPMISNLLIGYYTNGQDFILGQAVLYHHRPEKFREDHPELKDIIWLLYNFDIFDALISNRPFRPAYRPENALIYLRQLNRSFSMPMDIIFWLEKKLGVAGFSVMDLKMIPVRPLSRSIPLN